MEWYREESYGDILKPKVVDSRYAIIKIVSIKEPTVKSFEEAKELVKPLFIDSNRVDELAKLSEKMLKNIDEIDGNVSNFISLRNIEEQNLGLNKQEKLDFGSKLFTSNEEKGIISIKDRVIIYKILEQKRVKR